VKRRAGTYAVVQLVVLAVGLTVLHLWSLHVVLALIVAFFAGGNVALAIDRKESEQR